MQESRIEGLIVHFTSKDLETKIHTQNTYQTKTHSQNTHKYTNIINIHTINELPWMTTTVSPPLTAPSPSLSLSLCIYLCVCITKQNQEFLNTWNYSTLIEYNINIFCLGSCDFCLYLYERQTSPYLWGLKNVFECVNLLLYPLWYCGWQCKQG